MKQTTSDTRGIRAIALRFGFVYVLLFTAPFAFAVLPGTSEMSQGLGQVRAAIVQWFARNVFGRGEPLEIVITGSGDTTYEWYALATMLVLATAATIIWSVVDRRTDHRSLHALLRIWMRYVLAAMMIAYGSIKLVGEGQFWFPRGDKLLQTYGESSPMGLLWTFMGYSPAYEAFAGIGELLGGVLLLFRRTTLLGSLILIGVLANVVMLNFCYDVPVKIQSTHWLAFAIALASHDARRLVDAIVLHRPTQGVASRRNYASNRAKWAARAAKTIVVGWMAWGTTMMMIESLQASEAATDGRFDRVYRVTRFIRDGDELPPLLDDPLRWRWVSFYQREFVLIRGMDAGRNGFLIEIDEVTETLTLASLKDRDAPATTLTFDPRADDTLVLRGAYEGATVEVELAPLDDDEFLLVNRGFHWVNDMPFNR